MAVLGLATAGQAFAGSGPVDLLGEVCSADALHASPWSVTFTTAPPAPLARALRMSYAGEAVQAARPVPVEYSDAYRVRAKIHKVASIATLPLFVANYLVGQKLYNGSGESDSMKGTHGALAATTGVLFGINTVTGSWNLWEGRKDRNHRTRRMAHGLLMMAADAGFLATAMLAPEGEGRRGVDTSGRSTHRTVAITSMGIATVGYLIMLLGRD
jgi:hypothetical protein